jgi:hypothetical protein
MNYLLNYSKWKSLNEGLIWDVIEKEPINGTTHKVKVKYLDGNSFKVKAVNDRDMVGADGSIDPTLMDGIVAFLKGHDSTDFAREYPALQDLATFYKDNFFTVNVKKENDNKQVIVFTIQKRANFKGVTPETKVIADDKAAALAQAPEAKTLLAASDKSLLQNTAETAAKPGASAVKIEKPMLLADLKGAAGKSGTPAYTAFDNAYVALMNIKEISALPFFAELKKEIKAGQLGDTAVKFAQGVIAGFGLKDKYGDPLEIIDQSVADKIASLVAAPAAPAATPQNSSRKYYLGLNGKAVYEQAAPAATPAAAPTLPAGFNLEAFTKIVGGQVAAVTTGDIKLPEGGLVKGTVAKGDAELKKAQQLIADKLGVVLAKDPTFIKFKGYGADGNYGPTTEKMVAMAKAGFELKDTDGATITAELINKLLTDKITESYLDLRGNLFEKFNVEAATKTSSSYVPKKSDTVKKDDTKKDDSPDATWFDNIKSNLETFGKLTVNTLTDGSKYYTLAPEGGDPDDYVNVFSNKRIIYPTKNQTYKGTVSADGTSITLDGGKKLALSAFLKNPAEAGSVDAAAEQGKQVWIASGNTEGFANVRMDSDSVNTLIYKHDDKSKSIGMLLGTTKDRKGYTWYTVLFPEAKDGYTQGRVRSDLVDLKAAK